MYVTAGSGTRNMPVIFRMTQAMTAKAEDILVVAGTGTYMGRTRNIE